MLDANELRDKYNNRQRGTDLEEICKLMDKNGITLSQLSDYIDNRPPSVVKQIQGYRKKQQVQRGFNNGRVQFGKQSRKSTQA